MRLDKKKKGFTLLELMVVVIIIGILASLALPRFITATQKAREAEARSVLATIRGSQLRYYLEHDENWAPKLADLDIDLDLSTIYTYIVLTPAQSTAGDVGQATAIPPGLSDFKITDAGVLSTF